MNPRHCEEQSDEAIQSAQRLWIAFTQARKDAEEE
jgi:hypothetical protein